MSSFCRLLGVAWRYSLVVTLPLTIFFGVWLARTERDFHQFRMRHTPLVGYPYTEIADAHLGQLLKRAKLSATSIVTGTPHPDLDLRVLHLRADDADLEKLNADLPDSGFEFIKGEIAGPTGMLPCRLRYRGDTAVHWGYPKKSWRIKMRSGAMWEGLASFNLLAPKHASHVSNFLGYQLASIMGLIAPRTELVNVTLNGASIGVHLMVEQLEESTLRANGVMPGDIYSGELIGRDRYERVYPSVFRYPGLWTKIAVNNHYPTDAKAALTRLTRLLIETPSESQHAQLTALLDLEAWGRFNAFETLAQSWHYDSAHNWRLFWDSNRGKLVPLVWDPIPYLDAWTMPEDYSPDVIASQLGVVLFKNGDFLRARQRAFAEFFAAGKDREFLALFDATRPRLERAVKVDPIGRPTSLAAIDAAMDRTRGVMTRVVDATRAEFLGTNGEVRYAVAGPDRIALQLTGRVPVDDVVLRFDHPLPRTPRVVVRTWRDDAPVDTDVSGAVSVRGSEATLTLGLLAPLQPQFRFANAPEICNRRRPQIGHYELIVQGGTDLSELRDVHVRRAGHERPAVRVDSLARHDVDDLFRAVAPAPLRTAIVVRGKIHIEGDREILDDVVIEAGTTITFAPGANLRFWGRLLAEGTEAAPIEFGPANEGQAPWGVVTLQGHGCDGSRLRHCHFALGSGWKQPLWEYSAMFNVHDVDDVQILDCRFRDSQVVDDMVHAIYCKRLEMVRCTFERSLSDAIDLDICSAVLRSCVFRASGNDSVDLMTCQAVITDTLFENAGDKGISVGEGSWLLTVGSTFRRCNIGTQGKDSSRGAFFNCEFDACNVAVDCYQKNWRYDDGGHLSIHKSRFIETNASLTADARSSIRLFDCYTDFPAPVNAQVSFDDLCDQESRVLAREREPLPFPPELARLAEQGTAHFQSVVPALRGPVPAPR